MRSKSGDTPSVQTNAFRGPAPINGMSKIKENSMNVITSPVSDRTTMATAQRRHQAIRKDCRSAVQDVTIIIH